MTTRVHESYANQQEWIITLRSQRCGLFLCPEGTVMPMLPPKHRPYQGKSHGETLAKKRKREVERKRYLDGKSNLYKTQRWQRLRKMVIAEQPICIVEGCSRLTTDVDHVLPHRGKEELFFAYDNLQGMCKKHHSRKTATYDGGFGNAIKQPTQRS